VGELFAVVEALKWQDHSALGYVCYSSHNPCLVTATLERYFLSVQPVASTASFASAKAAE